MISGEDIEAMIGAEYWTPPEKGDGWQPIETAPRDGTEILTIRSNGYIAKGRWYDNPFGRQDTVIENESGKWWSVTHWMPLPPPPTVNE
jgi:hypothetical protein